MAGWWSEKFGDFNLALTPAIGLDTEVVYRPSFELAMSPSLQMVGAGIGGVSTAAFDLAMPPSIGASAINIQKSFELGLTPTIGMAGAERYSRSLPLSLTPTIGMGALSIQKDFGLSLTPTIGMVGAERYSRNFGLSLTPTVGMAGVGYSPVSYDSTGVGIQNGGATGPYTVSWSHTIGSGANYLVVATSIEATNNTFTTSAKVGTTSMTPLGGLNYYYTFGGFYVSLLLFGLANPPTGAQTVSVTGSSGTVYTTADSVAYKNVVSIGSVTTNTGTGSTASITATSDAGEMVLNAFTAWQPSFSAYTKTQRYLNNNTGAGRPLLIGDAAGAATVSFAASGSTDTFGAVALRLKPV